MQSTTMGVNTINNYASPPSYLEATGQVPKNNLNVPPPIQMPYNQGLPQMSNSLSTTVPHLENQPPTTIYIVENTLSQDELKKKRANSICCIGMTIACVLGLIGIIIKLTA